jgi:hypothetical protein
MGSDGMVVTGPAVDRVFEFFNFFVVFKAVACTGVLASCDDAKGAVAAESRLSLGMTGFVDVVELAFALRAIL